MDLYRSEAFDSLSGFESRSGMEENVLSRLQNFKLRDKEEEGFCVSVDDFVTSKEEWSRSLIGKIFGDKVVNYAGLKNTMSLLWSTADLVKIREMGVNLFQFVFANQTDMMRILKRKNWTFDSQFLILKQWQEGVDYQKENFNKIQIWIQVWNLPNHWLSKEIGFKLIFLVMWQKC